MKRVSSFHTPRTVEWMSLGFWTILAILLLLAVSCDSSRNALSSTRSEGSHRDLSRGQVVWIDLEGGFYGIVGEDQTRYLPKDLSDEFQSDGLRVRFHGSVDHESASIAMWGPILILTHMERE